MQKLTLISIGLWMLLEEQAKYDPGFPDPRKLVDPDWEVNSKSKIIRYLKSGQVAYTECGCAHDRFTGEQTGEMGCSGLTDGVFIWPEGLSVYLDKYNVRLPKMFVDHVKQNNYIISHVDIKTIVKCDIDNSLWIEWGKRNTLYNS